MLLRGEDGGAGCELENPVCAGQKRPLETTSHSNTARIASSTVFLSLFVTAIVELQLRELAANPILSLNYGEIYANLRPNSGEVFRVPSLWSQNEQP